MITTSDIKPFLPFVLEKTDFADLGDKYAGKVRDVYTQKENRIRILIATDRQSAFDINWCTIPLKGQVLNQLSAWWFEKVADIMPNHVIATPDPNVMVAKDLRIIPIEIVVRGFLTGSTKTSAWMNYNSGVRDYCGNRLPDGMVKNQPFESPIVTPTTKSEDDELIDPKGIIEKKLATFEQWEEIYEKAIQLFKRGQEIAAAHGLILVDTKYEMGINDDGIITLADEVHTPDSSRYWIADSYEKRFNQKEEPESLDKEFFRLWMREHGFEYKDKSTWPKITDDVRVMLSARYIDLFGRMTGEDFILPDFINLEERIMKNIKEYTI